MSQKGTHRTHDRHQRSKKGKTSWRSVKNAARKTWEILKRHAKDEAIWFFVIYTGALTLHVAGLYPLK